ncbi:MAG: FecR domain-containing protein, partial [Anaerolineae bacterium]|nr:FecR domain-containing protein [Anaerolineae bacterium]
MILVLLLQSAAASSQGLSGELAATLEVLSSNVEVRRVDTVNWISVKVEAIVGVGDLIRTDDTGKARITFFADGVDVELQPNTEYRIDQFEGHGDDSFSLSATVLLGQSLQRIERLLDANSNYDIDTPGMELTVRGTQFRVRVEPDGRTAALVLDGTAAATAEQETAEVPMGYGVRSAANEPLSDVVLASSFEQLDAALDG